MCSDLTWHSREWPGRFFFSVLMPGVICESGQLRGCLLHGDSDVSHWRAFCQPKGEVMCHPRGKTSEAIARICQTVTSPDVPPRMIPFRNNLLLVAIWMIMFVVGGIVSPRLMLQCYPKDLRICSYFERGSPQRQPVKTRLLGWLAITWQVSLSKGDVYTKLHMEGRWFKETEE